MSFDEIRLPLRLSLGAEGGPVFNTEVITTDSGYEKRNQNWATARRKYNCATALRSTADINALLAFFMARAGRARGFRLKDWLDFSSAADHLSAPAFTNQLLGTGNGTQTQFQLQKIYTSGSITHTRSITKPVAGTVVVGLNGIQQLSGWSLNTTTGLITFSTAPGVGVNITAGFEFDVPVRFDTDALVLTMEDVRLQRTAVPLVELKVLN